MTHRTWCAILCTLCLLGQAAAVSTASAQGSGMLRDSFYELSPEWSYNNFVFSNTNDKLSLTGIRIHERNGYGGKLLATVIVATMMALGSSDREYMGSYYGYGYRIDYYRMKSSEEMAAESEARAQAIDETASNDYQFDLRFYIRPDFLKGQSNGDGFSLTLFPASWSFGEDRDWLFEFGFQWAWIWGELSDTSLGAKAEFEYLNIGMPLRFIVPITSFMYLDNQWDLNFLWMFGADEGRRDCYDAPFHTNLTFNIGERLFVRGGATLSGFELGKDLGYQAEVGFRF